MATLPRPHPFLPAGGAVVWLSWWRVAAFLGLSGLLFLWARALWTAYRRYGLFRSVGVDWAYYYAQAGALMSGDATAIYRLDALDRYLQPLAAYNSQPMVPLPAGHVPYPPLFALLFVPFTWPPPPVGFALWTALNVCAAGWLAWRVAQAVSPASRPAAGALLLVSLPVVASIATGQVALLLGCAFAEAYRAFRQGQDFRAGLWIAVLLVKPQYGILLGLLLLWKRRWATVAGVAIGAVVVVGGSLVAAGPAALLAYPAAILEEDPGFRSVYSHPEQMINWRALVLLVAPDLADRVGLAVTGLFSLASIAVAALAWRGRWDAASPSFSLQVSIMLAATLLATYHSHVHGAVILAVPLAAVIARLSVGWGARMSLLAAILAPSIAPLLARLLPADGPRAQYGDLIAALPAVCVVLTSAVLVSLLIADRRAASTPPVSLGPADGRT